ncbi:MAG TPA: S24/S26 family peptidase [Spirochaetota bacterium]|nr:S24/S26 family peptidase [Spirochaetota bacterium]
MERIIGTVKEKERSPVLAVFISLFFTGLGQWYCGEPLRAVVLFLLRFLPIVFIPFITFADRGNHGLFVAAAMIVASIAVWAAAPVDAFFLARRRSIIPGRTNSLPVYALFALITTALIAAAAAMTGAMYRPHIQGDDAMEPLIRKGDILLVGRFVRDLPPPGSVVVYRGDRGMLTARVMAREKDRVAHSGSMIAVNGDFLLMGIYGDIEVRKMGLDNSEQLFYEMNDGRKYPVRAVSGSGRLAKYKGASAAAGEGRVFVADDNRLGREWLRSITTAALAGRVEGVLWGGSWRRVLVLPFLKIQRSASEINTVNIVD